MCNYLRVWLLDSRVRLHSILIIKKVRISSHKAVLFSILTSSQRVLLLLCFLPGIFAVLFHFSTSLCFLSFVFLLNSFFNICSMLSHCFLLLCSGEKSSICITKQLFYPMHCFTCATVKIFPLALISASWLTDIAPVMFSPWSSCSLLHL